MASNAESMHAYDRLEQNNADDGDVRVARKPAMGEPLTNGSVNTSDGADGAVGESRWEIGRIAAAALAAGDVNATLASSVLNLSNTTLGAGIVSIPFFFSQCGFVLGTILLLAVAVLSATASWLLVNTAMESDSWTYLGVAHSAYGQRGVVMVQASILALTAGVCSAFFVQLGETGSEVMGSLNGGDAWWTSSLAVKLFSIAFPLLPLCAQRSLAALGPVSGVVLLCILFLVGVVTFVQSGQCGVDDGVDDGCADDTAADAFTAFRFGPNFFTAVPIAVLAFGNQVNVHQVVTELRQPTERRVNRVIVTTTTIVTLVYTLIGIAGYARFGLNTTDNILSNYHGTHQTALGILTAARLGIIFIVLFSYPMLLAPCRNCAHAVLRELLQTRGMVCDDKYGASLPSYFAAETVLIIAVTFGVAVGVPSLGTIMGFTGAVMGTLLGFIFPAAFYLKRFEADVDHLHFPRAGRWIAASMLGVGCVFMVVCVSAQVASMAGA